MGYTWQDGDLITAARLNQTGGGYDLRIDIPNGSGIGSLDSILSNITVSGDILDCEEKLENGEIINAICVWHDDWSVTPSNANTNKGYKLLPMTYWSGGYRTICFGGVYLDALYDDQVTVWRVTVMYDASDGSLTHAYGDYKLTRSPGA